MRPFFGPPPRGPLARPRSDTLARTRPVPALYRLLDRDEPRAQGALARDDKLAALEAALMAADEPLTPRRLASVAGLADATEARRLVHQLQALLEQDGSAFQVEEI